MSENSSWSEGLTFVDDLNTLSEGVANGDWLDISIGTISMAGAAIDPIGTLLENSLGWLIENLHPLKDWLQELTGNPGEVNALAGSWDGVHTDLSTSAGDIVDMVLRDLGDFEGQSFDAYRTVQDSNAALIDSIAVAASSIASGLRSAAEMVQIIYELTRDVLAMIVSNIVEGLATAWIPVIGQLNFGKMVVEIVGEWVPFVKTSIDTVLGAFAKLQGLLGELGTALRNLPDVAADIFGGAGRYGDELALAGGGMLGITRYGDDVADLAADAAKAGDKASDVADTASDVAKASTKADDVTDVASVADDLADGGEGIVDDVVEQVDNRPYLNPKSRPSFRKGVRDKTWVDNMDEDGIVWDPSGVEIPEDLRYTGEWDMGHKPGHKYSDEHAKYKADPNYDPADFRDWYNDPNNYRPELPRTNRSHKYE